MYGYADFLVFGHYDTQHQMKRDSHFISADNQGETAIDTDGDEIESAIKRAKLCAFPMVLNSQRPRAQRFLDGF